MLGRARADTLPVGAAEGRLKRAHHKPQVRSFYRKINFTSFTSFDYDTSEAVELYALLLQPFF
jgi:hypothetical protein